jgi:Cof subfamily protein (haloacid dehalogenase superfamily)
MTIRPRVRRALASAQARGIPVTLATGRGLPATLRFARQLHITVPLICYQGGLIQHPLTGEQLYRATLEKGLLLEIIELSHARNWHLLIYTDQATYVQEFRKTRTFYDTMLGSNIKQVDDLARVTSELECDPAKFLIVAEKTESNRVHAELVGRFGRKINVVRSHTLFVEGNPIGVSKGDALRRLAEYLGVPQAQVVAIGDQGNDVSMLAWAGLGIAMGNGSQAAKTVSDWIAPPLSADGAAVAIERALLS